MIRLNLKSRPGKNYAATIALLTETVEIIKRDAERSRINYAHRKNGCRWVKRDGKYTQECRCPPRRATP